jgi:hypothetical protein
VQLRIHLDYNGAALANGVTRDFTFSFSAKEGVPGATPTKVCDDTFIITGIGKA